MTGSEIVRLAKEEMAQLTGLKPDSVSGLRHDEEGWHVTMDMLELKRIPESSDVLDIYEALMDDDGNLITYRRTGRYLRGGLETVEAQPR